MTIRNDIIATLAAQAVCNVSPVANEYGDGLDQHTKEDLANEVFTALCDAGEESHSLILETSPEWMSTGYPANGPQAQARAKDFQDVSALGDWDGYDLCSVQETLQAIFNQAEQILINELQEDA